MRTEDIYTTEYTPFHDMIVQYCEEHDMSLHSLAAALFTLLISTYGQSIAATLAIPTNSAEYQTLLEQVGQIIATAHAGVQCGVDELLVNVYGVKHEVK